MLATVKFLRLTDAQTAEINAKGWNCVVGRAYLAASYRGNPMPALLLGLYQDAARGAFEDLDSTFRILQNGVHSYNSWTEVPGLTCTTEFPRSMSVGDIVLFDDGRMYLCAGMGWNDLYKYICKEEGIY